MATLGEVPAPWQHGEAIEAMQRVETALSHQQSASAEFDREVIEALLHAHETTEDGRRRLDELAAQVDRAAHSWDLGTTAGAREFQRFLVGKLRDVVAVVNDANDDDAAKQALAAAWAALYACDLHADPTPPDHAHDTAPAAPSSAEPPVAGDDDPYLAAGGFDASTDPYGARPAPPAPMWSAGMPGFGSMPDAGASERLPEAGLFSGIRHRDTAGPPGADGYGDDDLPAAAESTRAETSGDTADDPADDRAKQEPEPGALTATLPDGRTITAPTPVLAAVIQAVADGAPIADAFHEHGIGIPSPGTPVADALDRSDLRAGDIGMFTDRHALAVGNGEALLDGELHHVANLRGPSFLGWQHPVGATAPAGDRPAPTRLSEAGGS